MIATITFSPTIDYTLFLNELNVGCINSCQKCKMVAGGKGVNVSQVLKNLSVQTTAMGYIGGESGQLILRLLEAQGIKCDFVPIDEPSRINVKLRHGMETDINLEACGISEPQLWELSGRLESINNLDTVVIAGKCNLPQNSLSAFLKGLKKRGVDIVVDMAGNNLLETLTAQPYLIKPNIDELNEVAGGKTASFAEAEVQAKKLIAMGAQNVLLSLGSDGGALINKKATIFMAAPSGIAIDTVGAGDSMLGGFIYAREQKLCDEECLKWAIAAGSATAFTSGLASGEQIRQVYKKM